AVSRSLTASLFPYTTLFRSQTLYHFAKEMFGKNTKVRFRPSYFPFTEPSAEIDISCQLCDGKGCNICKGSGWVEIGGSGMVDPRSEEHTSELQSRENLVCRL